ncbi:large-conductance mechanosensitive channel protein MscL [Actinophytocola glycyrrhizae]|uniref:Large-conductance mechanosensitive channel n=1 Tax=Actinophytocola glycyrrhizae TaxID=2044873 RepID=A0ABV9S0I0_9PSEU
MFKGFKDFLMRGNVVDLAVAVIIGTAFTAIVTAIANNFIKPLIAAIGGANVSGLSWTIVAGNEESRMDFAAIITAAINFLIIAAVVYFLIVLPMKKLQDRRRRGDEAGPSEPTDIELLAEIRDLLRQQQQRVPMGQGPQQPPQGGMPPQGGRPPQRPY